VLSYIAAAHASTSGWPGSDRHAADIIRFAVAEQWATLDLLSGGRVDFAAGRGYDSREYAPFHVSFAENQEHLRRGMEVIPEALGPRKDAHLASRQSTNSSTTCGSREAGFKIPMPALSARSPSASIELAARLAAA